MNKEHYDVLSNVVYGLQYYANRSHDKNVTEAFTIVLRDFGSVIPPKEFIFTKMYSKLEIIMLLSFIAFDVNFMLSSDLSVAAYQALKLLTKAWT